MKKRSYEYHNPVLVDRIPGGGYIYCHWYGRVPNCQNKFLYGVEDAAEYPMSLIKGVLKDRPMLTECKLKS